MRTSSSGTPRWSGEATNTSTARLAGICATISRHEPLSDARAREPPIDGIRRHQQVGGDALAHRRVHDRDRLDAPAHHLLLVDRVGVGVVVDVLGRAPDVRAGHDERGKIEQRFDRAARALRLRLLETRAEAEVLSGTPEEDSGERDTEDRDRRSAPAGRPYATAAISPATIAPCSASVATRKRGRRESLWPGSQPEDRRPEDERHREPDAPARRAPCERGESRDALHEEQSAHQHDAGEIARVRSRPQAEEERRNEVTYGTANASSRAAGRTASQSADEDEREAEISEHAAQRREVRGKRLAQMTELEPATLEEAVLRHRHVLR